MLGPLSELYLEVALGKRVSLSLSTNSTVARHKVLGCVCVSRIPLHGSRTRHHCLPGEEAEMQSG